MSITLKKISFTMLFITTGVTALAFATYRPLPNHPAQTPAILSANPTPAWVKDVQTKTAAHPKLSEVWALSNGQEAFAVRMALAAQAGQSIDAQYYIWHNDVAGQLLLSALLDAGNRGVKVRLLLDDNNTRGMDDLLASLDAHPNIEVRLFNPFMHREGRMIGYLSDFFRLNRRMHNKSFTVDGVATVVGGRNVGDEYFGLGEGVMFADMDVLTIGQSVSDVKDNFNQYWQSESVYPLASIITEPKPLTDNPLTAVKTSPEAQHYLQQLAKTDLAKHWQSQATPSSQTKSQTSSQISTATPAQNTNSPDNGIWATTHLLSDDPKKGLGQANISETVVGKMQRELGAIHQRLTIVSPYFVPTQSGADALIALKKQGVQVKVLTNALSATDVAPVHAGYAKYRPQLLANGVQLFELKPDSTVTSHDHDTGATGSSGSSLHAKTFSIDGKRLFVGSFNMDPRSAKLNTEMGFLIDSPELASHMDSTLDGNLAKHAYAVTLTDGKLQWQTQQDGKPVTFDSEPNTSKSKQILVKIMQYLPIESLL